MNDSHKTKTHKPKRRVRDKVGDFLDGLIEAWTDTMDDWSGIWK